MNANKFTRADIAKTIADAGVERVNAGAIALAIVQAMADALTAGKVIELRGFGTLEQRERKARTMHNPRTMAAVDVPAIQEKGKRWIVNCPCCPGEPETL
jgi:nucleoid DNA-binding protein